MLDCAPLEYIFYVCLFRSEEKGNLHELGLFKQLLLVGLTKKTIASKELSMANADENTD